MMDNKLSTRDIVLSPLTGEDGRTEAEKKKEQETLRPWTSEAAGWMIVALLVAISIYGLFTSCSGINMSIILREQAMEGRR